MDGELPWSTQVFLSRKAIPLIRLACLILDLSKCHRSDFHSGGLFRAQNLNVSGSCLNDNAAVRAHPCLFATKNLDRIATDAVDRKRVPVFGFQ